MSIESELSKLRHPSNSKNFPILGSVPPSHDFKFPMTEFLKEDLGEYADDEIANEIPEYYPQVAHILFSDNPYNEKYLAIHGLFRENVISGVEFHYFQQIAGKLSDLKIGEEARSDTAESAKLPSSNVNNTTKTGISPPRTGGNVGIGESFVAKTRKRLSLFLFRLSGVD